jgi:hypothetical protein
MVLSELVSELASELVSEPQFCQPLLSSEQGNILQDAGLNSVVRYAQSASIMTEFQQADMALAA